MGAAFEAHEDLGLDTVGRVDVFDAIVTAELRLIFRELECAALYLPSSVSGRAGVLVNAHQPLAMQRYSAAHEYGHHVFDHGGQIDRQSEPRGRGASIPPHEMLAEAFAAWFLMPPEAIEAGLRLLGLDAVTSVAQAYALALRLGTSFKATCTHVRGLAHHRDTVVKTIKQGLSPDPPPGGWRHDVWLLSDRDAEATVVARCGDTLLFELAGWDIEHLPDRMRADIVAGPDLLSPSRWRIDLPLDLPAEPQSVAFRQAASTITFSIDLQHPRKGRYFAAPRTPA
jgi:hypothetical protein